MKNTCNNKNYIISRDDSIDLNFTFPIEGVLKGIDYF